MSKKSKQQHHYQLWNPSTNGSSGIDNGKTSADHATRHHVEEAADFFHVRISRFCTQEETADCIQIPHLRTLIELINSSLVVGQEVSLTVILLAVHREIVTFEDNNSDHVTQFQNVFEHIVEKSSIALALVYASLIIIVYYNQKSLAANSEDVDSASYKNGEASYHNDQHKKNHRRKKVIVRLSDGILLAVILRIISGMLRSLTASYSTDTVYALSITGMVVHLLVCDYNFANGFDNDVGDIPTLLRRAHYPRPKFLGGTVSLNAAFFATILLVSRIKSNVTSYAFVSSVVTLFAFYPMSRHQIARNFPNSLWASPCFAITAALSGSAWLLLAYQLEKIMFVGLQLFLLVLSPLLQWRLQRHKMIITGKWDIAHIK